MLKNRCFLAPTVSSLMAYFVAILTPNSARSCVMQSTLPTKGMRSIISTVSISLKDFLPSILLLMVIIVAVVIVTLLLLVRIQIQLFKPVNRLTAPSVLKEERLTLGGVNLDSGDEIEFSEELKELLPIEAGK
ncbi:hypothetical protein Tco_1301996 [Tanacetum coccineum]